MTKEEIKEAFKREQEEKQRREEQVVEMASAEEYLIAQAEKIYRNEFRLRTNPERNDRINVGNFMDFATKLPKKIEGDAGLLYSPALEKVTVDAVIPATGKVMVEIERPAPTSYPMITTSGYSIEPMTIYHVWFGKNDAVVIVQPLIVGDDDHGRVTWLADAIVTDTSQFARVRWRNTIRFGLPRFLNIMNIGVQWLMYNRPEVMVLKSAEEHGPRPSHSNPAEDYRKVRVQSVYSVDFTRKPEPGSNNPRKFSCPCWGVAGHIRHYKNGKEVWIKPYRKGVDRDKPETYSPKEYVLMS